tara:strand:+ start:85 stop:876 length:792 start_codon:yes stop_codon:yes gene_type:complete
MQYVNDVWIETLKECLEHGREVSPRRDPTKEFTKTTVIDMNYPILTIKKRKLGYKFMAAEAYWILTGDNRVESIAPYSKTISNYSDDCLTFFGAYGPKFVDQSSYIISTLIQDKYSRQAVCNIWRERPGKTKDVPCTLNLQWVIRENRLDCHANMRSSDLWLGWPYDTFNFSMLTRYIKHCYDDIQQYWADKQKEIYEPLQMGYLYLHSSCMHLYKTNFEKAEECIADPIRHIEPVIESTSVNSLKSILFNLRESGFEWPKNK